MHPSIAISCDSDLLASGLPENQYYVHYARAVAEAGGRPIFIALGTDNATLEGVLSEVDGLLLPGGCDVQPSMFGEEEHEALRACNGELDVLEELLACWAIQNDVPTLGICRGMQLMNVVLGGTLYQDLPEMYPASLEHLQPGVARAHRVYVDVGSKMEAVLGTGELWVNSRHHQAIKELGKGVRITGRAEDGVAELLEVGGYRFMMAVQCHPEDIYQDEAGLARLFAAFVEACHAPVEDRVASGSRTA